MSGRTPVAARRARTASDAQAVRAENETLTASFDRLAQLTGSPNVNDPTWVWSVLKEATIWHQVYADAQTLQPPACLANAQQAWLIGLATVDRAGTEVGKGLAALEATRIKQAAKMATHGRGTLNNTAQFIQRATC